VRPGQSGYEPHALGGVEPGTGPDGGGQLDSDAHGRLVLSGDASSAREARHFVRSQLEEAGYGDGQLRETVVLVASELATNAIRHVGGEVWMTVRIGAGQACVGVHDTSSALPAVVDPYDGGGRGMLVVASVTTSWEVVVDPGGKTVWACFTAPRD
jgi:anti-sigma regulatory factor (Ser/Thr protein kinase)